jgi:hypothetical protein
MSQAVAESAPETAEARISPRSPRWYHLSSADVVFAGLSLLIFFGGVQHNMLDDPGLGWHLRNLDAMRAQGGWLTEDPFSQRPGRPWRTNQWLGEAPLWLAERWAGLEGVAVATALVLAWALRCLYRMLQRDGLPWPAALLWTMLAALGTSCSWVARPNIFTIFFVLITARVCERYHAGILSRRTTLWLLPLFAVWANVHGGFLAGLSLVGLTLVLECGVALLAPRSEARRAAWGRAVHLSLLFVGSVAATLFNPYGYTLYPWLFSLLGDPYFMQLNSEWLPPKLLAEGAIRFELLMVLFPVLLIVSRRRANVVEVGLAAFWLYAALRGLRYVPLFVVVVVPLLARSAAALPGVADLARRCGLTDKDSLFATSAVNTTSWVWSVVVAAAFLGGAPLLACRLARHDPRYIPAAELDLLVELHRQDPRRVVFNAYDWGGYLTWKGWPGLRTWIDDRNEAQGVEHIEEYFATVRADPGWEERLARDGVDLICVFPEAPLTQRLLDSRSWKLMHRGERALIFLRNPEGGSTGSS